MPWQHWLGLVALLKLVVAGATSGRILKLPNRQGFFSWYSPRNHWLVEGRAHSSSGAASLIDWLVTHGRELLVPLVRSMPIC